jgi:hypothetical protein
MLMQGLDPSRFNVDALSYGFITQLAGSVVALATVPFAECFQPLPVRQHELVSIVNCTLHHIVATVHSKTTLSVACHNSHRHLHDTLLVLVSQHLEAGNAMTSSVLGAAMFSLLTYVIPNSSGRTVRSPPSEGTDAQPASVSSMTVDEGDDSNDDGVLGRASSSHMPWRQSPKVVPSQREGGCEHCDKLCP